MTLRGEAEVQGVAVEEAVARSGGHLRSPEMWRLQREIKVKLKSPGILAGRQGGAENGDPKFEVPSKGGP